VSISQIRKELASQSDTGEIAGWIFAGCVVFLDLDPTELPIAASRPPASRLAMAGRLVRFAGGDLVGDLEQHLNKVTHVIIGDDRSRLKDIRRIISQ
jgi:hypothetical protein